MKNHDLGIFPFFNSIIELYITLHHNTYMMGLSIKTISMFSHGTINRTKIVILPCYISRKIVTLLITDV